MRDLALLCGVLLLLAACSGEGAQERAAAPTIAAARAKFRQALEARDRARAIESGEELLSAGESEPAVLMELASLFDGARRPESMIRTLERLLAEHGATIPEPGLAVRLWMGYGRACGLSGRLGVFLAPWSTLHGGPAALEEAADRGLVALLEHGRAAGRSEELRAEMEEAMRRAPALAERLREFLPLLGVDRAASTAARRSVGVEAALDAITLAAAEGRFEEARALLEREEEKLAAESPERAAVAAVQLELAIAAGDGLEAWLARELAPRPALELLLALGRYDEALQRLQQAQQGGQLDAVQSRQLHLKIVREAGRGEEALALVDRFLAEAGSEAGPLRLVRARVLLELGRLEESGAALDALEAAPPAALNLIALHQTRAIFHLLAGRAAEARAAADAARRIYPTTPAELEEHWGPAVFLAAPVEELPGIAFAWTRFPRLRDNDRRFHTGMRALLEGDRAKARSELEACIACSVGGEYPRRLAEAALRLPALQP
jgi:hypothetical protein